MNKKVILLTLFLGIISFGAMLAFGWLTKPSQTANSDETTEMNDPAITSQQQAAAGISSEDVFGNNVAGNSQVSMSEQQLQSLIFELRKKIDNYDERLQSLQDREQQIEMTEGLLKEDIQMLNNLRTELVSMTATIKNENNRLLRTKIEIDEIEQANLAAIAATYDQMKSDSAGEIIANMCSIVDVSAGVGDQLESTSSGFEDAVKILYYMTERTKAKLLAELASTEPQLAVALSRRLKMITEVN